MEGYKSLIAQMVSDARAYGDEVVISTLGLGKCTWTGNELADEIQNETDFGKNVVNGLCSLTLELVQRGKETLNPLK
jgi:hypothetical protein